MVNEGATINNVWPSGADFATAWTPMDPPPPGRLSTKTCAPITSPMRCPTMRPTVSTPLPGEEATMSRTGRAGYC